MRKRIKKIGYREITETYFRLQSEADEADKRSAIKANNALSSLIFAAVKLQEKSIETIVPYAEQLEELGEQLWEILDSVEGNVGPEAFDLNA